MSYLFFEEVLHALGKRINYDAISNYAGNSFAKDSWSMIQDANPLTKPPKMNRQFMGMLSGIKVNDPKHDIMEGADWAK